MSKTKINESSESVLDKVVKDIEAGTFKTEDFQLYLLLPAIYPPEKSASKEIGVAGRGA